MKGPRLVGCGTPTFLIPLFTSERIYAFEIDVTVCIYIYIVRKGHIKLPLKWQPHIIIHTLTALDIYHM